MQLDLEPHEIEQLIEALDTLKTKHAFIKKGGTYEERTAKLLAAEELETKLRQAAQELTAKDAKSAKEMQKTLEPPMNADKRQ